MAMAEKGINGKELAKLSGISEPAISIIRRGGGRIVTIVALFDAMGYELKYISKGNKS